MSWMSYRYNQPAHGSQNWHEELNENFDALARDVEYRDVEADLDEYDPEVGAKFYATDTGAIYVGDGTEWIGIKTTGEEPRFVNLLSENVNGVCWASENVDHLPSISEAVDRLDPETGRTSVVVVGGVNVVDESIDLSGINDGESNTHTAPISFATWGASIKQADGADLECVINCGGSYVDLDVAVDANASNQSVEVTGIRCFQARNPNVWDVRVYDADVGVYIFDHSERMRVRAYVNDCKTGIYERYPWERDDAWTKPDNNDIRIRAVSCDLCYRAMSDGEGSLNATVHLNAESCNKGIRFRGSTLHASGQIRTIEEYGVYIQGCENALINMQKIEGNGSAGSVGIDVEYGRGVTVIGSQIRNWATGISAASNHLSKLAITSAEFDLVGDRSIELENVSRASVSASRLVEGDDGVAIEDQTGNLSTSLPVRDADLGLNLADGSVVRWLGVADDEAVSAIDAHEGMIVYNEDDGTLNLHDGESWNTADISTK